MSEILKLTPFPHTTMISHRVLLSSLCLGAIQGAWSGLYIADYFHIIGFSKFALVLICYVVGVVLGFLEIETIKKVFNRK